MANLVVRKLPFDFDGVEFLWNPANPAFSIFGNAMSFQVIGFEKYMCLAIRDAERHIKSPEILSEARLFAGQESVHSQAHKRHVKVMIDRYPALQETLDRSVADFDALYRNKSLDFHLAYAANIEATFGPLFGSIINHRDVLFQGGDPRVSSLLLWHFCEEIEHRRSAYAIYQHVVGRRMYRFRQIREVFGHIRNDAVKIVEDFRKHVPGLPDAAFTGKPFAAMPRLARMRMNAAVMASQLPWHDPEGDKVPAYYGEWLNRYEGGEDMTLAYRA